MSAKAVAAPCIVDGHENWDELMFAAVASWEPEQAFVACDRRVRYLEQREKSVYVEVGKILCIVQDRQLWRPKYDGFESWLMDAAPMSRASAYQAMRVMREMGTAPMETLKKIPRANLAVLCRIPGKKKTAPEVLAAAEILSERDLRKKLKREMPEAHIDDLAPLHFKPEASQRQVIDEALELARLVESVETREEALEAICVEYTITHQAECEAFHANGKARVQSRSAIRPSDSIAAETS